MKYLKYFEGLEDDRDDIIEIFNSMFDSIDMIKLSGGEWAELYTRKVNDTHSIAWRGTEYSGENTKGYVCYHIEKVNLGSGDDILIRLIGDRDELEVTNRYLLFKKKVDDIYEYSVSCRPSSKAISKFWTLSIKIQETRSNGNQISESKKFISYKDPIMDNYLDDYNLKGYTYEIREYDSFHDHCPLGFDLTFSKSKKSILLEIYTQNEPPSNRVFWQTVREELEEELDRNKIKYPKQ